MPIQFHVHIAIPFALILGNQQYLYA